MILETSELGVELIINTSGNCTFCMMNDMVYLIGQENGGAVPEVTKVLCDKKISMGILADIFFPIKVHLFWCLSINADFDLSFF